MWAESKQEVIERCMHDHLNKYKESESALTDLCRHLANFPSSAYLAFEVHTCIYIIITNLYKHTHIYTEFRPNKKHKKVQGERRL